MYMYPQKYVYTVCTFTNIYICTQIWCIYNGFHTSCARNVVVGIIVENTLAAAQARFQAGLMLPWLINKHNMILSTMLQTFSACHGYWFCWVSSLLRGGWQEERRKTCKAPEGPELFLPFLFFHAIFRLNLSDFLVVAGLYCLIKACPIRTDRVLAFILVRRC